MAKLQFLLRPRYLRAIPSLVVLTTAVAWGMASDPDAMDTASKRASVAQMQGVSTTGASGVPLVRRWLKGR